jgi:hypothetical protein
MSAERHSPTAERIASSPDLETARAEKLAELNEAFKTAETAESNEKRADKAREVIHQQTEQAPPPAEAAAPAPARPAYLNHRLNYHQTLASMQRKLPELSQAVSRIIHAPAVEKASEVLESTVARPSVLLGSTWTALIVGTIFYLVARHYGYALSGSELLFSFVVGALLGLAGEGLWLLLKRR